MTSGGGAWDNAKKSFEGGGFKMPDGTILEKGSDHGVERVRLRRR